ncbi:hypothetical protein C7H19_14550 [Aphanothece hegewaldii CCALA 016]|uniref:Replication origin-binding protein domain-containing protein n=1 Tax=Aphanothece hegewaldii CCALA 016 TaxID=2107694 RepID=A0A2T1LW34_9CHRO|nr:plasmid replication protein, CyRepA1 family [Aphanothece hegewaldii]PSF35965.1 hypothetical protein C7H19_14550 [Aphanothece hegewaldii CCALA 016]
MSWKRFYRGDCPVCNGTRKDCRQNTVTGLIHCRDLEATPVGYIFRGYDSIGFGMWADQAEVSAWSEEKRQEWQEMRRRVHREREQTQRRLLLCDSERDTTIRNILGQLKLSEEHRCQLQQRGMNDEQIDSRMYRSVKQWQKLQFRVSDRLAGVQQGGKSLYVPASGVLCPITNHLGQFVAWQIRFDNPGEFPKYLWASSESKRRSNGPSAHLKNGELPLAFFEPLTGRHEVVSQWFKDTDIIPVALTEGIAFKPAIASQRLGIYTIGASGGHFASSPKTLKTNLEQIKAIYERQSQKASVVQPILFADAGCLVNQSILHVYNHTIRQLQELGFEPYIAWWGQEEKSVGDIDEINETALSTIRLLSCQEFSSLVKKTQRDSHVKALQHQLQSLTLRPNICLNSRYLPDIANQIPMQGIIALKSFKGSGKSVQIKKIIESARSRGMKVISLTPRRALGREQSLKWNIEWGGDAEISGIHPLTLLENIETVGICWDSLWKLKERDWSNTLVIIDESELALIHLLLSSTCKDKRPLILQTLEVKLRECLTNGGMLLIADADLTDLSINYFQALVPQIPTFIVINEYQSTETQWQVDFYTGKKDTAIAKLIADLATPITKLGKIERQQRIVIPTDSQDLAEALERYIRERFPQLLIVRIDSTTTETDEGRELVERPNEKLQEIQPDVLIYTPSMGAGVSIDLTWFDQMYAFFSGVIEPSQCRQMLGRVRDPIPRTIWCRRSGKIEGNTSFLPTQIKSHLFTFHRETNILIDVAKAIAGDDSSDAQIRQAYDSIWNPAKQAWDNPHVDLYCNLMARKNYGLYHLATELRRQLKQEGHRIIEGESIENTEDGLRVAQIKKQLPFEEAQAIATAEDIPLDVALLLKQKSSTSEQQRHQITKALLKAELPGVELTTEFVHKAITASKRKWLNAHKLFWYLQNPEKVKTLDRREWLDHLSKFTEGTVYLPDIRTYSFQVKVLRDLGLFDVINLNCPEQNYCTDAPAIRQLLGRARKLYKSINTAFHLKVTKQTKPIQFINHLLSRVGLRLKYHKQLKSGRRLYRIDLESLNDPDRLAVLESLTQKLSQTVSESTTGESQQTPININNTGICCDSPLFEEIQTVITQPKITQGKNEHGVQRCYLEDFF